VIAGWKTIKPSDQIRTRSIGSPSIISLICLRSGLLGLLDLWVLLVLFEHFHQVRSNSSCRKGAVGCLSTSSAFYRTSHSVVDGCGVDGCWNSSNYSCSYSKGLSLALREWIVGQGTCGQESRDENDFCVHVESEVVVDVQVWLMTVNRVVAQCERIRCFAGIGIFP
jgi:hypothetical protein